MVCASHSEKIFIFQGSIHTFFHYYYYFAFLFLLQYPRISPVLDFLFYFFFFFCSPFSDNIFTFVANGLKIYRPFSGKQYIEEKENVCSRCWREWWVGKKRWKNPMWISYFFFILFFHIFSSCCSWRLHINQYYTMRFPCTHIRNMHQKHIYGSSIKNKIYFSRMYKPRNFFSNIHHIIYIADVVVATSACIHLSVLGPIFIPPYLAAIFKPYSFLHTQVIYIICSV